jgi:hypothetical protein
VSDQDLPDPKFDAYVKTVLERARSDAPASSGLSVRPVRRSGHAVRYAAAIVVLAAAASIAVVAVRSSGTSRYQISPIAPPVTAAPTTTVVATSVVTVASLDAYCAEVSILDVERPESYVGSPEQIADIDGLIALAPSDVSGELSTLRAYLASGAITAADPESNVIANWPTEVQAAVAAVDGYRTANCPAAIDPTVPLEVRHLDHDHLAAELPSARALSWLPADVSVEDDSDLTQHLDTVDCAGVRATTPSRQDSATNRQYVSGQTGVVSITFYDVESVADAQQFIASLGSFFECPNPPARFTPIDVNGLTSCEEAVAVRSEQPVSQTIDAWCRVANLIAYVRLYPTGDDTAEVPPTDEQATDTMVVVGDALRRAWTAAG